MRVGQLKNCNYSLSARFHYKYIRGSVYFHGWWWCCPEDGPGFQAVYLVNNFVQGVTIGVVLKLECLNSCVKCRMKSFRPTNCHSIHGTNEIDGDKFERPSQILSHGQNSAKLASHYRQRRPLKEYFTPLRCLKIKMKCISSRKRHHDTIRINRTKFYKIT